MAESTAACIRAKEEGRSVSQNASPRVDDYFFVLTCVSTVFAVCCNSGVSIVLAVGLRFALQCILQKRRALSGLSELILHGDVVSSA